MTLKQLLEQCSWEQIEAVIPQYRMLDLRSEEDIIEIKYIKSLYERMRQLQPQKSRQKIRLFLEPDIDNWIEAEIACEQDGKLISRLFEASAKESIGMEVYLLLPVCRHKTRRGYVVFGLSPSNTYGMTKR